MYPLICGILLYFLSPRIPFIGQHVHASVVINELFPKTSDPAQSWVELYNNGSDSVSLDRWSLANITNPTKSYTLNASFIISGHTYLVLSYGQTGITFATSGDGVKLFNEAGSVVDSQVYESTLGYNIAMGRSVDGAGAWSVCTLQSPDKANTCPAPTASPTSIPTAAPTTTTAVATPAYEGITTQAPAIESPKDTDAIFVPPAVFGSMHTPTPIPLASAHPDMIAFELPKVILIPKMLIAQIGVVIVAWGVLMVLAKKAKKKKKNNQPTSLTP